MRKPKGHRNHECCPADWRKTSDLSGNFQFDASIARCKNKDMQLRLDNFLENEAYGGQTAYNGYHGYTG